MAPGKVLVELIPYVLHRQSRTSSRIETIHLHESDQLLLENLKNDIADRFEDEGRENCGNNQRALPRGRKIKFSTAQRTMIEFFLLFGCIFTRKIIEQDYPRKKHFVAK